MLNILKRKDKRPKQNRYHLTPEQLSKFSENYKTRSFDVIKKNGLPYEDNVSNPGEALLLFYVLFRASGEENFELRRRLANKFSTENYLNDFDPIDKQYLYNMASVLLQVTGLQERAKDDLVHQLATGFPDLAGVNPLLTILFRIVPVDADSKPAI